MNDVPGWRRKLIVVQRLLEFFLYEGLAAFDIQNDRLSSLLVKACLRSMKALCAAARKLELSCGSPPKRPPFPCSDEATSLRSRANSGKICELGAIAHENLCRAEIAQTDTANKGYCDPRGCRELLQKI